MVDLIGTALRGLRARGLLSAGSILLTALAIGSAVLAPIFSSAVVSSYGITRLAEAPDTLTGLSFTLRPTARAGADPQALQDRAVEDLASRTGDLFHEARPLLESDETAALGGEGRLVAGEGACEALVVEGACPGPAPGGPPEVLVATTDLTQNDLSIGDTVSLGRRHPEGSLAGTKVPGGVLTEVPGEEPTVFLGRVRIVGSYRAPATTDYWFDLSRLASVPSYENRLTGEQVPYKPAPIVVDPSVFEGLPASTWHLRLDSTLAVDPGWTASDRSAAAATAKKLSEVDAATGEGRLVADSFNELGAIDDEVRDQQDAARASIAPAVLSVVLVALALLLRLLLAAADVRRPELALASLRGVEGRRMWLLGLTEPFLLLLLAAPLGALVGGGTAVLLVRSWLVPDLPVPLPWSSPVAGLAVWIAAASICVLAVARVVRETLSVQLSGATRPSRTGRLGWIAQLAVLALAGVVLAAKLGRDGPGDADLTDLFLPVLLAAAAGLIATRVAAAAATWWTRHRRGTRSLSGFVAARALSRRTEGTLVVLPLTAAIAIGVFAAGVHDSAADWRHSVAATSAPADVVWDSPLVLDGATELTHELDPEGEHLMAVGVGTYPRTNVVYVDGPRLARVAEWPDAWTPGVSPEEVAETVSAPEPLPQLSGSELSLTLSRDAEIEDELWVETRLDVGGGSMHREYLGPFPEGTHTRSIKVPYCADGCRLRSMNLGGRAALPTAMSGEIALEDLAVEGEQIVDPWQGWTPAVAEDPTLTSIDATGDHLSVRVETGSDSGTLWLNAGGVPPTLPIVAGHDSDALMEEGPGGLLVPVNHAEFPASRSVEAESLPFLGPVGVLVDRTVVTAARDLPTEEVAVHVLARSDTPGSMQDALREHGLTVSTTLDSEESTLDGSAYALALRLYAVVAVLVLLMALAGLAVSTAVQMPSRRRDAASLRVVGVPRRSVMGAVALEFGVVLGGAAVAGGAAGALAQYVVLRTITLGTVETAATPRLVAAVDGQRLLLLAVGAAVVLGAVALVTAAAAVRGARGGTLR